MTEEIQKIIAFLKSSKLPEEVKESYISTLESGNMSEEFLDKIEEFIQNDIDISNREIEDIEKDLEQKKSKLAKVKESNAPKKKSLQDKQRKELKEVYDKAITQANHLAQDYDNTQESTKHQKELNDADEIRQSLGLN
ncbi:hypothetical protein HON22_00880 [Candidatus Peregrinibacteria bacterium]|jgi:hypothetical protein|nr:hypothetical protein [Candidatus Peregrinibacteria bacterium]